MKVIGNIATNPNRVDSLARMIFSVKDQFDEINVYCNDFKQVPSCLRGKSRAHINAVVGTDLADNGKFYHIKYAGKGDIVFTLDDDIVYAKDYVAYMRSKMQLYPGKIVTAHGRKLKGQGLPYYTGHYSHLFCGAIVKDEIIDVAGTGCTAFEITEDFHPVDLYRSKHKKMSDLIFSLEAALHKKQIVAVTHDYGWLKAIENTDGIAQEFLKQNETPIQNSLADEIFKLNYNG